MKQVVLITTETVVADDVDFGNIYVTRGGGRAFMLAYASEKDTYRFLPFDTGEDPLPIGPSSNMTETVKNAIEKGYKVYELQTEGELAQWLSGFLPGDECPELRDQPAPIGRSGVEHPIEQNWVQNKHSLIQHKVESSRDLVGGKQIEVRTSCGRLIHFYPWAEVSMDTKWVLQKGGVCNCSICSYSN